MSGRFDPDQVKRAAGAQASAAARVAEFTAALAELERQAQPEDFDAALALRERRAQARGRLAFARERLAATDKALGEAQEAARRAGLIAEKARLEREGDKRAATWPERWAKHAGALRELLEEMESDARACARLSDDLREAGEPVGLWSAEQRLRARLGLDHGDFRDLILPAFEKRCGRFWPKPVVAPMVFG